MTRSELEELIRNGENSGVEFKRDDIHPRDFAKEVVGLLNLQGGVILLGVEDDGSVSGIVRPALEEWVMQTCRTKVYQPIIPYLEIYRDFEPGKDIAIVRLLPGTAKPYARLHDNHQTYYIRVGSTTREASREELQKMFLASGPEGYGKKPVSGSRLEDLDLDRLMDYFDRVLGLSRPELSDRAEWERLLVNLEWLVSTEAGPVPTVDGMLLFGRNPARFLPQSGLRCLAFPGKEPDYQVTFDGKLAGPMVHLGGKAGMVSEPGLVEQALDFIRIQHPGETVMVGPVRQEFPAYPAAALREVIVNALIHRDYAIGGSDITLSLFADRLEVKSPGRLPNGATLEAVLQGFRYARNQTLVNVMRDYGYVEARGMGLRNKVLPIMKEYTGSPPGFRSTDWDFTVILQKRRAREVGGGNVDDLPDIGS